MSSGFPTDRKLHTITRVAEHQHWRNSRRLWMK